MRPNRWDAHTAEMGAAFLLYCARDVDRYREALRKPTNRAYSDAHLHGTDEYLVNRKVAMIGFGRVGRGPGESNSSDSIYVGPFTILLPRAHWLHNTASSSARSHPCCEAPTCLF